MGAERRMDYENHRIVLYSIQSSEVIGALKENGVHYAKTERIREKYDEVSKVFLSAYAWYKVNASLRLPRPPEAESAIWAYFNLKYIERAPEYAILKLSVPTDRAIFFRMEDWNKVLNLRFIGEDMEEERLFEKKLSRYGVKYEGDIYLQPFYPQLKQELIKSWNRLFRYNEVVRFGGVDIVPDVQAGMWELKADWVTDWDV